MTAGVIRVAVADDHPLVLMGIKALIEAEPKMAVASVSADGAEALRAIRANLPDVAVVDISMPEMNGIGLIRQLKAEFPAIRLLALTVHEDEGYRHLAMVAGVDGYLLKRSAAEELVRAIRCLVAHETYLDPAIAGKALMPPPDKPALMAQLSEREADVLRLLAQGFATKEIADRLAIGIKTVDTYKSRAAEKLDLRTRAQIVRFAASQGWLAEL
jgi:DNA-binding NarL/FixJ family response regulator